MSPDRELGPTCSRGSPGFVENTTCKSPPPVSRITTRHSWPGCRNRLAKLRTRSFQVSFAEKTLFGTVIVCCRLVSDDPDWVPTASKFPLMGGNAPPRNGTNVPSLIAYAAPKAPGTTVQPAKLPVSKLPLTIRLAGPAA